MNRASLAEAESPSPQLPAKAVITHFYENVPIWICILLNSVLFMLWAWLYWPMSDYLALVFTRADFRTNQIILLVLLVLMVNQIRQGVLKIQLTTLPQFVWLPLSVLLGGSLLYLVVERYLDINTISTSLFFLASYGLLGLWMEPTRWRQGLPASLLIVGTLPFGDHMQTFLGYPLRIATAQMVGVSFEVMNVPSVGVDTILTFENGIAQVDSPCSGVKSLWTGGLFLIAATWLERHAINLRWLLIGLILGLLLIGANFIRVAILVGIGIVGKMNLLAEVFHVPLGVLGFGVACGVALLLLRRDKRPNASYQSEPSIYESHRPVWLAPILMSCIALMALTYTQRSQTGLTAAPLTFRFPDDITTEVEPLGEEELGWLTKDGAESVDHRRFQWGGVTGTMLLISSQSWRAHHRPERCFEVKGLSVDELRTHIVTPNIATATFPVRLLSLGAGTERNTHSAVYWFQSTNRITDDYATRMWADLALQPERWILVSVLLDNVSVSSTLDATHLDELYRALATAVDEGLRNHDAKIHKFTK
ncbi:MAG: exosortase O [Chloroflexota bacterium]